MESGFDFGDVSARERVLFANGKSARHQRDARARRRNCTASGFNCTRSRCDHGTTAGGREHGCRRHH